MLSVCHLHLAETFTIDSSIKCSCLKPGCDGFCSCSECSAGGQFCSIFSRPQLIWSVACWPRFFVLGIVQPKPRQVTHQHSWVPTDSCAASDVWWRFSGLSTLPLSTWMLHRFAAGPISSCCLLPPLVRTRTAVQYMGSANAMGATRNLAMNIFCYVSVFALVRAHPRLALKVRGTWRTCRCLLVSPDHFDTISISYPFQWCSAIEINSRRYRLYYFYNFPSPNSATSECSCFAFAAQYFQG